MKKIYLLISVLFSISVSLFAQDSGQKKLGRIGISYSSFGIIQDVRNPSPARYDAGPSSGLPFYIDKNFYTIGIDYVRALNTWLEYEFGIEYSRKVGSEKTSYPYGDYIVNKANSTFVSFPFTMRANFLRFFFMNGGILMDLDLGGYKPQRY